MNPIKKGIIVGVITIIVYLTVVVVTTPALPADALSRPYGGRGFH